MDLRDRGFPNKWGILYCQTYDDLTDRHIMKFKEEFQGIGEVRETRDYGLHVRFHGEGLGGIYLRNLVSTRTKRGAERAYALFDELTEISYQQFYHALYTIRPSGEALPYVAVGAATNPDGLGHLWVKSLFVPEFRDMGHIFFKHYSVKDVFYVQALKNDNPAYADNKEIIDSRLGMTEDEDIRRARDEGSWDLYASGRFSMFKANDYRRYGMDPSVNVHGFYWEELYSRFGIPEEITPAELINNAEAFGFEIIGSLDYGTSPTSVSAYLEYLVDPNNNPWYFRQVGMVGMQLPDQAQKILAVQGNAVVKTRYADPSIGGRAAEGQHRLTRQEDFRQRGVRFELAINDRVEGWSTCASMLHYEQRDGQVVRAPRCRFLFPDGNGYGVPALIEQIPNMPRDPMNAEDVAKMGGIWHWGDSWRYGLHTRFRNTLPEKKSMPRIGSAAWNKMLYDGANMNKKAPKGLFE